jgi:hypothetical protein
MQSKRVLREPLLHFFAIGILLFALFSWVNDDAMQAPDEIVIDTQRVNALATQFQRTWQRPPTPDELSGLIDNWIREEVLYREGMALGLDRDDPVLRRRLAQKMEFISAALIDSPPTEDELRGYFDANREVYGLDPRFSFRQLYFDPSRQGEPPGLAMDKARVALAAGEAPATDASLLPSGIDDASLADVRRTFGDRFAESLAELPVGDWVGPVVSGYGVHLVYIDERQEARLPEFSEVRAAVERDFLAERTRDLNDAFYENLRERYSVTFEDGVVLANERENGSGQR